VRSLLLLLGTGTLLTAVFTAIAFLVALRFEDRARGFGAALLVWLACAVVYDGVVLLITSVFADYPLETPLLGLTILNPLDLGRTILLLDLDVAALMGYTGAVFQRFLGTALGLSVALIALVGWVLIPLLLAGRRFTRKDF
jgi:Cu-processing system permease protein